MSPLIRSISALLCLATVGGCGSASLSATPSGPASPAPASVSVEPSLPPSGSPVASTRSFPTQAGVDLEPGTYLSSPPFDIAFTFVVDETGWESGHLLGEYFDLLRFDGRPNPGTPALTLAFGHPTSIEGATALAVAGLSPDAAASALAGRTDLTVGDPQPFTLDGRTGVRIDIHADRQDTKLFRGPNGALGVGPTQDVRMAFVPLDGDLLLVLVQADADDLDDAWQRAEPILASVRL